MMKVELSRFKVKEGKSVVVDQWLAFLNDHMADVLLTLADEKMYVETIFRERTADGEFLYWYSVQGEGGQAVEQSTHAVDLQHLAYWDECIDESYGSVDLTGAVVMIPDKLRAHMC